MLCLTTSPYVKFSKDWTCSMPSLQAYLAYKHTYLNENFNGTMFLFSCF
uniref:Uncharacterized protein n=1 Tax=Anguilla anguilla TaxID=7936 RepID=A0A0E9QI85_ANGAN